MTHHPQNSNFFSLLPRGVWGGAGFSLLVLILLTMPAPSVAQTHSKTVRISTSRRDAVGDLNLSVHVHSALREVKNLDKLSVTVKDGVVSLLGPVPSTEAKKQAIDIARKIPGVLEVLAREVYLAKPRPTVKPLVLPLEDSAPTQTRSASPNSVSGSVEAPTAHSPLPAWSPQPNRLPPSRPAWPSAASSPSAAPRRIALMAPEAVATPLRAAEPAMLTANPRTPPPSPPLAATIDRLRRGDRRFRSIRTEIEGSTVRVFSGDTPGGHVMSFVEILRRLPDVQHVILKNTSRRPH